VLHDEPYDIRHVFAYATRVKGSCRFGRATMPQAIGTESKPLRCEDVSLRISFRWRVTFIGFFIPVCRHAVNVSITFRPWRCAAVPVISGNWS